MLEQMRKSSQSLLIYVLFGIVIAVFIINFGPQSSGACESGVVRASYAAKVAGETVTARDYRYGYMLAGGTQFQPQRAREMRLKERVLDELIERELLVDEAERLGFRVREEEVEDMLLESKMIGLGGFEQTVPAMQKDGAFDYDSFIRFAQFQLGLSPKAFIDDAAAGAAGQPGAQPAARRGERVRGRGEARLREAGQPGEPGVRPLRRSGATRSRWR